MDGTYRTPSHLSPPLADLLSRMLCRDPDVRIRLDEIWEHPWMAAAAPRWDGPPDSASKGQVSRLHPILRLLSGRLELGLP